ncbi:MAG: Holliday junction DNA helicase RuvA [Desulfamplus sp.]|nr:Holliday junction DNA helicase RuvA [Desulfamplus sp.]
MIVYIEGKLLKVSQDGIVLMAGHVGYEILLPVAVLSKLSSREPGTSLSLHIYYYQTERQPKPVLIGFYSEEEKEFFQHFISVDAIGPLKAVKAMEKPVEQIARAIEEKDIKFLSALKGIGKRTAEKIVASLNGKVSRFVPQDAVSTYGFAGSVTKEGIVAPDVSDVLTAAARQVTDVLVGQLGYTPAVARRMVAIALAGKSAIETPEQLFEAVLRQR